MVVLQQATEPFTAFDVAGIAPTSFPGSINPLAVNSLASSSLAVKEGKLQSVDGLTWKNPGFVASDEQPVVCVTRDDALKFCSWLSKQEDRQYSLPTEAQWEFACRGGTIQSRFWGDAFAKGADYCVSSTLKADLAAPQPVGSCQPNPLGLFDMLGNVHELCLSQYGEYPPCSWKTRCITVLAVEVASEVDHGSAYPSNCEPHHVASPHSTKHEPTWASEWSAGPIDPNCSIRIVELKHISVIHLSIHFIAALATSIGSY
ncbi:MAG: sulfatase activating formylglycine-generating enzyme [Planctomycetaceae bacterium]